MPGGTGQQPWGPGTGGVGWNSPGSGAGGANRTVPPRQAGTTTLGEIVKVCIERYFEIFEDVPDRGEALPVPSELSFEAPGANGMGLSGMSPSVSVSGSSLSGSTRLAEESETSADGLEASISTLESVPRSSVDIEDDELNEAMLVMSVVPDPAPPTTRAPAGRSASMNLPISTSRGTTPLVKSTSALAPTAWSRSPKMGASVSTPALSLLVGPTSALTSPTSPTTPLPRHRRTPSSSSTTFSSSPYTTGQGSASGPGTTIRGARSVISIERKPGARKGSIALGRSASGSSASPVAAMGVTATGFFEKPS